MIATSLEKKLASYALAGGAAMLVGDQAAEAAVMTVTPPSPLVATVATGEGDTSLYLDMDSDGNDDFVFFVRSRNGRDGNGNPVQRDGAAVLGSNGGLITGTLTPNVDSLYSLVTNFGTSAAALASNPTLSKALLLARYNSFTDVPADPYFYGEWTDGVAGILGVRFMRNGTTPTMGFINARVNFGSATITIDQYGFDTGGDVPEPGTMGLLALGAVGMAALRRRRAAQ